MSIQGLSNIPGPVERRSAVRSAPTAGGSAFQDQLTRTGAAAVTAPSIHLRMPGENTVYSGARGGGNGTAQEIYAEYTADSTPEDPVVHVTGTADSGPFDFVCHVHDIDPSNASYAEMAVLYGHLVKSGAYRSTMGEGVLPTGLETGDVAEKRDYLSAIDRHQYDHHFGGVCRAQASELLALYQPYASGVPAGDAAVLDHGALLRQDPLAALDEARLLLLQRNKEGREWQKKQEEWDRLMKGLDSWIDALRARSERERKDGNSGGVTVEGGEALMALYRGYIAAAVQAKGAGLDPEVSREDLLSALTWAQSTLLERLKVDRASEEEREEWVDLLRRQDRWLEFLQGDDRPLKERARRPEVSVVGRKDEYEA